MNTRRVLATACSTLVLSGALGLGLLAQESTGQPESTLPPGGNALPAVTDDMLFGGTPLYSLMKSGPGTFALNLSTAFVNAFTPIAVPCPATAGRSGCTVRVTVSAQFWNVTTAAAMMKMDISGPGTLGPASEVNVASRTDPFWGQVNTMQWVKRNIPAGSSPTVTVQVRVHAGTGFLGYEMMSVDVFKGLF